MKKKIVNSMDEKIRTEKLSKHGYKAINNELDRLHKQLEIMIEKHSYNVEDFRFVRERIIKLQDMLYPVMFINYD